MAARDDLLQILPVRFLIPHRPPTAPGDPDPVELRLLEQPEHLLEIAVVDVGQYVLLFGAELLAPPGSLGLPALDSSTVQPNETKISLFRPRRHVRRLGAIQFGCRLKRLGGAEKQGGGDQTNQSNVSYDSDPLQDFLASETTKTTTDKVISRVSTLFVLMLACEFAQDKLLGQTEGNMEPHAGPEICEYKPRTALRVWVVGIGKRS